MKFTEPSCLLQLYLHLSLLYFLSSIGKEKRICLQPSKIKEIGRNCDRTLQILETGMFWWVPAAQRKTCNLWEAPRPFLLIILLKPDIFNSSRCSQERRLSWGHEGDDLLLVPGQRAGNRRDAGAAPPGRAGHDLRGTLLREKHQRLHPEGAAGGEERGGSEQELVMKSMECVNNSRGMDCVAGDEL